jgi:hypothetical protein
MGFLKIVLAFFREIYNYEHCCRPKRDGLGTWKIRVEMTGEKLSATKTQSDGGTFPEVVPFVSDTATQ